MPEMPQSANCVRFGAYEADLRAGELRKQGRRIKLAGRPFQILAILLERPGELITRQELQQKLWSADTFVDFEHCVNSAIKTLREALGDSAKKPRFVETLARRGYRFVGAVEKMETASWRAAAPHSSWIGQVATLGDDNGSGFVLVPANEGIMTQKESLEAAHDDLGISLLVASEKLLLVACGTSVRVLEVRQPLSGCLVRILEGQYTGETAFVPRKYLMGLS
ncbi:MAG: winged helix-turn-helix domain-containing protein [Candidatus Acidiferrales bacterium]